MIDQVFRIVEQKQDQHRRQASVPNPIGAPHRPPPKRAGDEAHQRERGSDRRLSVTRGPRQARELLAPVSAARALECFRTSCNSPICVFRTDR